MKIAILGAAGFIGTNLSVALVNREDVDKLVLAVSDVNHLNESPVINNQKVKIAEINYYKDSDYDFALSEIDIVFHLISTTNPTSSNHNIADEITNNIDISVKLLEACVRNNVKRIIFTSSGGTVYGDAVCPIMESQNMYPINTYGIQKLSIEKLLYLYFYIHSLDYRVARLSNPYGPYQRPNGRLGAITTFTYRVIKSKPVIVYGDGSVIRDYIYIDDAVNALITISLNDCKYKVYNIGSGRGVSINSILKMIEKQCKRKAAIEYTTSRGVDVKENFLNVSRYEEEFGKIETISIDEGIARTASFLSLRRFDGLQK